MDMCQRGRLALQYQPMGWQDIGWPRWRWKDPESLKDQNNGHAHDDDDALTQITDFRDNGAHKLVKTFILPCKFLTLQFCTRSIYQKYLHWCGNWLDRLRLSKYHYSVAGRKVTHTEFWHSVMTYLKTIHYTFMKLWPVSDYKHIHYISNRYKTQMVDLLLIKEEVASLTISQLHNFKNVINNIIVCMW
jgi:hypothetical protein